MNNEQAIIAVVHDGVFHSDEVMACALLKIAAGEAHVAVIRSRLPKDWERADYVIDVGGRADGLKWFDHHQQQGGGTRENGLNYSSFGLMWEHLGTTAVRTLLSTVKLVELTEQNIQDVCADIEPFIMAIDAHDQACLSVVARCSVDHAIRTEVATIQTIISGMNCIPLVEEGNERQSTIQFYKALDFGVEFLRRFILRKASKVLGYAYATSCYTAGPILVLDTYCDWHAAAATIPEIEYVIYPSVNGKNYAIQAVKGKGGSNSVDNLRRPFPSAWAGVDTSTLVKLSGVETAVFCHRDRFIASCSTLNGAVELANKSINYESKSKSQ